jgi:hypothetical protein
VTFLFHYEDVLVQVYLAVPSDCPFHPDGSKRKLSAEEAVSQSVLMYVSGDEGTTFTEVRPSLSPPIYSLSISRAFKLSQILSHFRIDFHLSLPGAVSTAPKRHFYLSLLV